MWPVLPAPPKKNHGIGEGENRERDFHILDARHALRPDEREDLLGDVLDGDDALELRLLAVVLLLLVREPLGPFL